MQVRGPVPQRGAPLVGQEVHRDGPPTIDLAEYPVERHGHVVVEDLAELGDAVHGLDRPGRDPRGVHVDEQRGDPSVRRLDRTRSGEQDAARRVLGQARPDLLPVHPPALVGAGGAARQGGEVAPGPRLREALAPDLVAAEQPRHHLRRQVLVRIVDHRRREDLWHRVDAGFDQVTGGERLADIGPQQGGAAQTAHPLGPAHAHETGFVGEPHDLAQLRHLLVEGADALEVAGENVFVGVEPVVDGGFVRAELHRPAPASRSPSPVTADRSRSAGTVPGASGRVPCPSRARHCGAGTSWPVSGAASPCPFGGRCRCTNRSASRGWSGPRSRASGGRCRCRRRRSGRGRASR